MRKHPLSLAAHLKTLTRNQHLSSLPLPFPCPALARNPTQTRHMSDFIVKEHVVRCQHSRDRAAGAERGSENTLKLHVKQYIPRDNVEPSEGDVTIIGAHANGFPKEMYEPFWDGLRRALEEGGGVEGGKKKRRIRAVWIADIASQGTSGVVNEGVLGPDASWWDHGRDLLFLINQFQDEMPHPLIGIGHSVGGSHLAHLSLLHPRLLHSLILVDPIIQRDLGIHTTMARLSTPRRDIWPSRGEAARKFANSKFYQQWDPEVLQRWIQYGLRDLPTEQYPDLPEGSDGADKPVTLSTTTAQEVYFYLRAVYPDDRLLQEHDNLLGGIHPDDHIDLPFSRPESQELFRRLPEIKPSVMYVFGAQSPASPPEFRQSKMELTGSGHSGSGGAKKGRVQEAVLDCGHLVGFEMPEECANTSASFMSSELERWNVEEQERETRWRKLSRPERVQINERWRENLGGISRADSTKEVSKL